MVRSTTATKKLILIYGASGFGREVAWLLEDCKEAGKAYKLAGFIDDDPVKWGKTRNDIPVMGIAEAEQLYPGDWVVSGVGNPFLRERMIIKASQAGFRFITIIHPRVELSRWVSVGEGSIICAGNILTTNVQIGKHVQINIDCTIGHDVVLDDYTTLAPGVHVSGWVHFGRSVYVGTGAVIINGTEGKPITIGDDAVIGAGACVTKSIPTKETWVGVPAKVIK